MQTIISYLQREKYQIKSIPIAQQIIDLPGWIIQFLMILLIMLFIHLRLCEYGFDDAFIHFRIVENWFFPVLRITTSMTQLKLAHPQVG